MGVDIWGAFNKSTPVCLRNNAFVLQTSYKQTIADKSQINFLKYILGVNRQSSNVAAMTEKVRYPMYLPFLLQFLNICDI